MTDERGSRESLADYGMTHEEIGLWYDLAALAGRFLQLPTLHPNERDEAAVEFHRLQNRLLALPGLRAVRWPGG